MEKISFTFRVLILLAALPIIMFTELTRPDQGAVSHKASAPQRGVAIRVDKSNSNQAGSPHA